LAGELHAPYEVAPGTEPSVPAKPRGDQRPPTQNRQKPTGGKQATPDKGGTRPAEQGRPTTALHKPSDLVEAERRVKSAKSAVAEEAKTLLTTGAGMARLPETHPLVVDLQDALRDLASIKDRYHTSTQPRAAPKNKRERSSSGQSQSHSGSSAPDGKRRLGAHEGSAASASVNLAASEDKTPATSDGTSGTKDEPSRTTGLRSNLGIREHRVRNNFPTRWCSVTEDTFYLNGVSKKLRYCGMFNNLVFDDDTGVIYMYSSSREIIDRTEYDLLSPEDRAAHRLPSTWTCWDFCPTHSFWLPKSEMAVYA